YLDESGALTVVPVRTSGTTFIAGHPAKMFDTAYVEPNPARHYDVSSDGQRFLMVKDRAASDPNATPANMVVVEQWLEELKTRVPCLAGLRLAPQREGRLVGPLRASADV